MLGAILAAPVLAAFGDGAVAAPARCSTAYSYAGVVGRRPVVAVAADVGSVRSPTVRVGHVAAWVGVSAARGWLQVGLAEYAGGAASFYVEVSRPGGRPRYTPLPGAVAPGHSFALAVRRVGANPGRWQPLLDGRPVGAPVALAGGGGPALPMAMAESANDGTAACNGFRFAFDGVRVIPTVGANWEPLTIATPRVDPGYRLWRAGRRLVAGSIS